MALTATQVIDSEILPHVEVSDWEGPARGEPTFGPNQVIAAYNTGLAKGVEKEFLLRREQFDRNLDTAAVATKKLVDRMRELGITPLSASLRAEDWDYFEIMVTLPESNWLSESAEPMIESSGEIEEEFRTNLLYLIFHFCSVGDYPLNEARVRADGYTWIYKPLVEPA